MDVQIREAHETHESQKNTAEGEDRFTDVETALRVQEAVVPIIQHLQSRHRLLFPLL